MIEITVISGQASAIPAARRSMMPSKIRSPQRSCRRAVRAGDGRAARAGDDREDAVDEHVSSENQHQSGYRGTWQQDRDDPENQRQHAA
jgi:hypothetical protein